MGRPPHSYEVARLNLELPRSVKERLFEIRDEMEAASLGEVIRRLVAEHDRKQITTN